MRKNNKYYYLLNYLVYLLLIFVSQKAYSQTDRGISGIDLDISEAAFSQLLKNNSHNVSFLQISKNDKKADSFYDDYHMTRYLQINTINNYYAAEVSFIPEGEINNNELKFRTDLYPARYEFKKVSIYTFHGKVFNIDYADSVSLWRNESAGNNKIFMVLLHLNSKEKYQEFNKIFNEKYASRSNSTLGRVKLVSDTYSWDTDDTSIRLIGLEEVIPYQSRVQSFELAFIDKRRTVNVVEYINTLMRLAPNLEKVAKAVDNSGVGSDTQNDKIIRISDFSLDANRSSYHKEDMYKYSDGRIAKKPFYNWNYNIIKQHVNPEEYFNRYEIESRENYFKNIHDYFINRVAGTDWGCRRMIDDPKVFWTLPFNNKIIKKCNNVFPDKDELEKLFLTNSGLYGNLMHWYSKGFGIPYPVFNIHVYNNSDEQIVITDIIYRIEYIDQYLPAIIENPPIGPFEHMIDVSTTDEQILPLSAEVAGLSIKPKSNSILSILLKSTEGIGHVCKVNMKFVVIHKGAKKIITDENLEFFTVLNSKRKAASNTK